MVERTVGLLAEGSTEAAATLRALLAEQNSAVQLRAAQLILDFGQRLRESAELEQRLVALEEHIQDSLAPQGSPR